MHVLEFSILDLSWITSFSEHHIGITAIHSLGCTAFVSMQVQERFDVDITVLPDHIDKELYRHDE